MPKDESFVDHKDISERFMFGDLLKAIIFEIKQMQVAWGMMSEKDQQKVLDRLEDRTKEIVMQTVRVIAGKARPTVEADIEQVVFKDGIKVTLIMSKQQAERHAISDAVGGRVLLILPVYDEVLGGDIPLPTPDQADLLPDAA